MNTHMDGAVRLRRPDRMQSTLRVDCDDELIPQDHPVRIIWAVVDQLDLSAFYELIKAREGVAGRNSTDPRLLISLWLYACTDGVGSARELKKLCKESLPYRWLCGGIEVNHHTLSDFRVGYGAALDNLFTQVLASLVDRKLVQVNRISQDGTRVRAGAGIKSFRRRKRLEKLLEEAREHVREVRDRVNDPVGSANLSARKRAAMERAARQRQQRVEGALAVIEQLEKRHEETSGKAGSADRKPPRASTTDPDARIMKTAENGWRPAINVQLATDTQSRAVVGVSVCSAGSDKGLAPPMRDQVEERTSGKVREHLVDGGFLVCKEIEQAHEADVTMYVPPVAPKDRSKTGTQYFPKSTDSPALATWRIRMGSESGKKIYRQRASTIETINADLKTHRGLTQLNVRGLAKVKCVVLWCALAYNLMHFGGALLS